MGISFFKYPSPLGVLNIYFNKQSISRIEFNEEEKNRSIQSNQMKISDDNYPVYCRIYKEFNDYFTGNRMEFDLSVMMEGSNFQKKVWEEIRRIPYGETRSYGFIARNIENRNAARAVGIACHKNPVPIIIPCHRVIGSDGCLTGYAGGLSLKKWLLAHERKYYILKREMFYNGQRVTST